MTKAISELPNLTVDVDGHLLVAPCMECTFYFYQAPLEVMQDFADRALAALNDRLTHYVTGSMARFAARGPKSDDAYAVLFKRPKVGAMQWLVLRGAGFGQGISPAELSITYQHQPPPPATEAARAAKIAQLYDLFEVGGSVFSPPVATIRVTFPLDHPLADPAALKAWIKELACVKTASFVSGHAGYAINADTEVGDRALRGMMDSAVGAALARHPGLGIESPGSITRKLLKYWPGHVEYLPRIKRVQWLTFVRKQALDELCGGSVPALEAIGQGPGVGIRDLGEAVMLQAGPAPDIGDVTSGSDAAAYRHIARILAPARLPGHAGIGDAFDDDAATAWLTALERPVD